MRTGLHPPASILNQKSPPRGTCILASTKPDLALVVKAVRIVSALTEASFISNPRCARASQTALATAAGGATAPPSPTPLTPSGLSGDGECWCTIVIAGTSAALGSA